MLSDARSFLKKSLSLRSNGGSRSKDPESGDRRSNRRYANDPSSGNTRWPDNTPSCSVLCVVVRLAWQDNEVGYLPCPSHPVRCANMCKNIQQLPIGRAIEGWLAKTNQRGRLLPSIKLLQARIKDQGFRSCSIDQVH